jgi:hypothetical protein
MIGARRSALALRGVLGLVALFTLAACGLKGGRASYARSTDDEKSSASTTADPQSAFSEDGAGAAPSFPRPPSSMGSAAASPSGSSAPAAPVAPLAGCLLVCNVAHVGRMAAAEEARFTSALGEVTQSLHQCVRGSIPSMTLRFDSQGALTHFGLDAEETSEGTCVESARYHRPALTFRGPSTVRCAERCR